MKYIILVTFLTIAPWASAQKSALPEPLNLLIQQGGEVVEQFDAPAGMQGYIADFRGQVITLYVTSDDKYMFTGAMLDTQGNNLGEQAIQDYMSGPKSIKDWKQLETSHWVLDGSPTAKRIVYTFTDPNCPYCSKFWQNARPWVDSGQVQIRHILVGILRADSQQKAAAILAAEKPSVALAEHQVANSLPNLKPLLEHSTDIRSKLMENHQIMMVMGASATPATFYQDETGVVQKQMGLPPEAMMTQILGHLKEN